MKAESSVGYLDEEAGEEAEEELCDMATRLMSPSDRRLSYTNAEGWVGELVGGGCGKGVGRRDLRHLEQRAASFRALFSSDRPGGFPIMTFCQHVFA